MYTFDLVIRLFGQLYILEKSIRIKFRLIYSPIGIITKISLRLFQYNHLTTKIKIKIKND